MKTYFATLLLTVALVFFKGNCFSQSNIIILIDSRMYYNDDDVYEKFSATKSELCKELRNKLSHYSTDTNLFSLYAYTTDFDQVVQLAKIMSLKKWNEFSFNDYRRYQNTDRFAYYMNAYDFLKTVDNQISQDNAVKFFKSTLFVVVGQLGEQFFNSGQASPILSFIKKNEFDNIDYTYYIKSEEPVYNSYTGFDEYEMEVWDTTQPLRTYALTKSIENLFTEKNDDQVIIECDRRTMPGKEALQIFPINNAGEIPIKLSGMAKIQIQSCVLSKITGVDNNDQLLHSGEQIIFATENKTLPNELTGLIDQGTRLSLYSMLQPYLQLKAANAFNSLYTGKMTVNFLIVDDIYSHAIFCDTINFKISLPEPKSIYIGFQRNKMLDNANLIEYGNKKFPSKEVTQDDIAAAYKSQLKIGKVLAIILGGLIVFLFWFFIRKNRSITWRDLRSFYK